MWRDFIRTCKYTDGLFSDWSNCLDGHFFKLLSTNLRIQNTNVYAIIYYNLYWQVYDICSKFQNERHKRRTSTKHRRATQQTNTSGSEKETEIFR